MTAIPRTPELDETRLHDQRPEVWLTAEEVAANTAACTRPVSPQTRAAVANLSRWAHYRLCVADSGESFSAEEAGQARRRRGALRRGDPPPGRRGGLGRGVRVALARRVPTVRVPLVTQRPDRVLACVGADHRRAGTRVQAIRDTAALDDRVRARAVTRCSPPEPMTSGVNVTKPAAEPGSWADGSERAYTSRAQTCQRWDAAAGTQATSSPRRSPHYTGDVRAYRAPGVHRVDDPVLGGRRAGPRWPTI